MYSLVIQSLRPKPAEQAGVEKTGKTGSSLPGNFVIREGKNKEIHKETIPH